MTHIERFIEQHAAEIERIKSDLASNFEAPAQRIINAGFSRMNADRFDRAGNDLWEMITCHVNGWEYEKPPVELAHRWARY
jgi:hypothetical protein